MKPSQIIIGTYFAVTLSLGVVTDVCASSGDSNDAVTVLFLLVGALIAFCIYFAPALIAFKNKHSNRWVIAALNVCVAPTLIGWVLLLIWAKKAAHRVQGSDGTDGGESGLNVFANDVTHIRLEGQSNTTLAVELVNLERLRARGALTDSEFSRAKERLLAS